MKKIYFWTILFWLISNSVLGQKMDFLPEQNLWETQTLDPLASQAYGQMAIAYNSGAQADYYIAGFAFGFQRSIFAWPKGEDRSFDLGFEGAALTQFEWTDRTGEFQRNIVSTDFLIGMPLTWKRNNWLLRLRVYHLSAHIGDDYMIRNKITGYYRNNNNYEQLDFTTALRIKKWSFSLGAGSVLRASQPRKPLVFTAATDFVIAINKAETISYFIGFYSDARQDYDFRPAINIGTGFRFGKAESHPFKILFTYFNGPLPYSVYAGRDISWFGLGFYIQPF